MARTLKDVKATELRWCAHSLMEGLLWSLNPERDKHLTSGLSSSLKLGITLDHLPGAFYLTLTALPP